MKYALVLSLVFISFARFASAALETSAPECHPLEVIEAKTECVPPTHDEDGNTVSSDNDSSTESVPQDSFEQLENK